MKLSLAGWSLSRRFRAPENPLKLEDFPAFTRDTFGLDAVELNSPFFASRELSYLATVRGRAEKAGVQLLNIAVDEKGDLSADDAAVRAEGLENYGRWIPVARELGCTAIRANSGGKTMTDTAAAVRNCTDSFQRLAAIGVKFGIVILLENHWGLSADADRMVQVIEAVRQTHGPDAAGTLPDFGNWPDDVDRYTALEKIMPYAKAVHAKVNDIDENLNHPRFDHARCLEIARRAGYDGWLGIEFEGPQDQVEGVQRGIRKLRELVAGN